MAKRSADIIIKISCRSSVCVLLMLLFTHNFFSYFPVLEMLYFSKYHKQLIQYKPDHRVSRPVLNVCLRVHQQKSLNFVVVPLIYTVEMPSHRPLRYPLTFEKIFSYFVFVQTNHPTDIWHNSVWSNRTGLSTNCGQNYLVRYMDKIKFH